MIIVVDTNVLVSGLLNSAGPPGQIVDLIVSGDLSLCFDDRILFEYEEVLRRPEFPFSTEAAEKLLAAIFAYGVNVEPGPLTERLPDRCDEAFLEVALSGGAECLITGNIRHYPLGKRQRMTVLAPAQFLNWHRTEGAAGTNQR